MNKIKINKKSKAQTELENLAIDSIIREICPDLTKYDEVYMQLQRL